MFQDELILEWVKKYDNLTSFSFMVYLHIDIEDIALLSKGVSAHLMFENENPLHAIIYDTVDLETAKALGTYQGTSVSFIFPGKCFEYEEVVKHVVISGLDYLRIKGEYLGATEAMDYA